MEKPDDSIMDKSLNTNNINNTIQIKNIPNIIIDKDIPKIKSPINEKKEEKKIMSIKIDESEQKNKKINDSNNNKIPNGKKVTFDDRKIIIKYDQNDYIKKSIPYIQLSKKDKKPEIINHNFIKTNDLIKKIRNNQSKNKSLLLLGESYYNDIVRKKNLNFALNRLNQLISEENQEDIKNTEKILKNKIKNCKNTNKYKKYNTNNNTIDIQQKLDGKNNDELNINKESLNIPFIQKNIDIIKILKELKDNGIDINSISDKDLQLLTKRKGIICSKFLNNPQNFFSKKLSKRAIIHFQNKYGEVILPNDKSNVNKIDNVKKIINKPKKSIK
jgi:hypothetical protein